METTNTTVALVYTQYVESYSEDPAKPFYKFKGGSTILVPTDRKQTAMALVCQKLAKEGRSSSEYPTGAFIYSNEAEAIAAFDEWERERIERIELPVA